MNIKENINTLTNTKALEEFLFALIYWVAVIVVILLVFYIFVKITNLIREYKGGKSRKNRDNFLD